jgi:predicted outer membrane repeat protein
MTTLRSASLAIALLLLTASSSAATIYVNGSTGNDAWTGLCETWDGGVCGPKRTIQAGINATTTGGDIVIVADGTYSGAGNSNLLMPARNITVRSQSGASACAIDALLSGRCIQSFAGGGSVTVDGFTFLNAASQNSAVNISATTPTIRHCTFRGMRDATALLVASTVAAIIEDCLFEDNVGTYAQAPTPVILGGASNVTRCIFRDNRTQSSAPIRAPQNGRVIKCLFEHNSSAGEGGALNIVNHAPPLIEDCTFRSNRAASGGAIAGVTTSTTTIRNCEFSANRAIVAGGAVYFGSSNANIVNCVFVDNTSDGDGGAVCLHASDGNRVTTVSNSILVSNSAAAGPQFAIRAGARLTVDYCNVAGGSTAVFVSGNSILTWGGFNLETSPEFAFPNSDLRLLANSPCIEAGTTSPVGGLPVNDPEGALRALDGDNDPDGISVPDIGLYEFDRLHSRIALAAEELTYFHPAGDPNLSVQVPLIRSAGGTPLDWSIASDCNWLTVSPSSGQSSGEIDDVTLTFDSSALAPGAYVCHLTVSAVGALNTPRSVRVIFNLNSVRQVPSAYPTIQDAVNAAADGDTIALAPRTYAGAGNRSILITKKTLKIVGLGATPAETLVKPGLAANGFVVRDWSMDRPTVFENLTIQQASAGRGAGIFAENVGIMVRGCVLRENQTVVTSGGGFSGSAIFATLTDFVLEDCAIENNTTEWSGAVRAERSSLQIRGCRFSMNNANGSGGGLSLEFCRGAVTDCAFEDNASEDCAGAMNEESDCEVEYTRCEFRGNHTAGCAGSAARLVGSHSTFANCEFADGPNSNGMVAVSAGAPRFVDSTFAPSSPFIDSMGLRTENGDVAVVAERCTFGPGFGYGIFGTSGTLRLTDCTLIGNLQNAAHLERIAATFVRCVFSNAPTSTAPMINIDSPSVPSQVTLVSCNLFGNSAGIRGNSGECTVQAVNSVFRTNQYAVVLFNFGVLHATNCTFLELNSANNPRIYLAGEQPNSITNSIVWRNSNSPIMDIQVTPTTSLSVRYCLLRAAWPGEGNLVGDPLLSGNPVCGPVPLDGSPVIDAGDTSALPADIADIDDDGDTAEPLPLDFARRLRSIDDPETEDSGVGPAPVVDIGALEFRRKYGDLDHDADVDLQDLTLLLSAFGDTPGGDLDGDGDTDLADLALLLGSFGDGC